MQLTEAIRVRILIASVDVAYTGGQPFQRVMIKPPTTTKAPPREMGLPADW